MGMMVSPETLRRYWVFGGLDWDFLRQLAMAGEVVTVEKGEWLFYEGQEADSLYIVLEGSLTIKLSIDKEGARHAGLTTVTEGEVLGWSAIVAPHTYRLGACAVEESKLAKLNGKRVRGLTEEHPRAGYEMMRRLAEVIGGRLTDLSVRFVSLIEGDRWQRLAGKMSLQAEEGGRSTPWG